MHPFAYLHRPETTGAVEHLVGDISTVDTIAELPDGLALVPFRQVRERGYTYVDDGTPMLALRVRERTLLTVSEALQSLPDLPIALTGGHFDIDDDAYAATVRRVVDDEIGAGEGANFVVHRSYLADISDFRIEHALSLFRRLLLGETGAYWTFLVHTGDRTLVGATPERHVSLDAGEAVMNPISGTVRFGETGPAVPDVLNFLADGKETDELAMVLDEELKMMARVCPDGGRVDGPYLRQMTRLAHTEYFIRGRTGADPRDVLAATLFAPTVTGSPLENACRAIARHERRGRGYYGGVVALIGPDELDAALTIRTADISATGRLSVAVGATLVRHSDPAAEAAETEVKAAALLGALTTAPRGTTPPPVGADPRVQQALRRRNADLAPFWFRGAVTPVPALAGRRVLVVDAEDTFTAMLAQQLRALGLTAVVRRYDEKYTMDGHDVVVLGPGPGDPREHVHRKIAHLRAAVDHLLEQERPFLAVCLSHQVLADRLGLPLHRCERPNQGLQRGVDLFGRQETVGFYNTYAARWSSDTLPLSAGGTVDVARDQVTGEVHGLRGPRFASVQFHPESVLTRDGPGVLASLLVPLLGQAE